MIVAPDGPAVGKPIDVAAVVTFLAIRPSVDRVGQLHNVDGDYTAQ